VTAPRTLHGFYTEDDFQAARVRLLGRGDPLTDEFVYAVARGLVLTRWRDERVRRKYLVERHEARVLWDSPYDLEERIAARQELARVASNPDGLELLKDALGLVPLTLRRRERLRARFTRSAA
jgi:hypothetical protein